MRVLSFDQASSCGWCLMEDENILEFGVEKFKNKGKYKFKNKGLNSDLMSWIYFCGEIKDFMVKKIEQYKPDIVILEGIQDQKSHDVHTKLSCLVGILSNKLEEMNVRYCIYRIVNWKLDCGIDLYRVNENGRKVRVNKKIQKQRAIEFVKKKYKFLAREDEADAICMALAIFRIKGDKIKE